MVYSRLESAIVRSLFPQTTRLTGTTATHAATIAALQQPHSIFHFSGHGRYDEQRPENSAIGLTDAPLTAKTIATLKLAAYEMVRFYQAYLEGRSAADALSIAQTWLQIITWAELATWLEQLLQTFPQMDYIDKLTAHYANILENQGKLESTQPPFAAPYYWAGFMLTGASRK